MTMIEIKAAHYYTIRKYGPGKFSIDACHEDGGYIHQVAFFFRTAAEAKARAEVLIARENAAGEEFDRRFPDNAIGLRLALVPCRPLVNGR